MNGPSQLSMVMIGYSIIGRLHTMDGDIEDYVRLLTTTLLGTWDAELLAAFRYSDTSFDNPETGSVTLAMDRLKERIQITLQNILDHASKAERKNAVRARENFLKHASEQHELGTVNEIAKKYNISKSEVRRRKADGTLVAHINSLQSITN